MANLKRQPSPVQKNIKSSGFIDNEPPFYTKGIICHPSGELSAPGFQTKQQFQQKPTHIMNELAIGQHNQLVQSTNVGKESIEPSLPDLPAYKMTAEPRGQL